MFATKTLPFDTTRANALYEALFGPIADVIKDKHLLIVLSGALTQLPFQVLITDKPDPAMSGRDSLRRAAWLVRSHALTVLPSVSSLKALRHLAKESHVSRPLIGFGNPLLDGPDARYAKLAAAARARAAKATGRGTNGQTAWRAAAQLAQWVGRCWGNSVPGAFTRDGL